MSKKNRYKFRDLDRNSAHHSPVGMANSSHSGSVAGQGTGGAAAHHAAEYRIIRADMIRLVILNALVLAAVLVVYFTNRSSGYLERLFRNVF